ncbi:hypothetical protein EPUL_002078, partial [Erysiphe pulchra]
MKTTNVCKENNEGFIQNVEAQTTQYASRSGAIQSEYLTA